jgi:hypothetical protein
MGLGSAPHDSPRGRGRSTERSVPLPVEDALMSRSCHIDEVLAGPPPEALDEVYAAWERAQVPLLDSLELAFASEPALGRAWGELRLPDGTCVARLPARDALAIACGDVEMLPVPALA